MRLSVVISATLALGACGSPPSEAELREAEIARAVQEVRASTSRRLDGRLKRAVLAARIEDDETLVVSLINAPYSRAGYDTNAVRRTLRPLICGTDNYRLLMENGYTLRVRVTSERGAALPPFTIANCA